MSASNHTKPELLAPAGDWDALRAAVANGADAVYFGLEEFNARRRAANFTLAALPDVIGYLHDRNTKGYVAFNTLIFSDELARAAAYVTAIAGAGADAVIVQDLGLARLIRRMAPTLPIHASTQMTQTEPRGIEYLRSLGVRRVILARELSLAEIARIAERTSVELEVFVHGALCISYSGQCLASESLFGRSANRGECAQACRLPYRLVVDGQLVAGEQDEADLASLAAASPTRGLASPDPEPETRNPMYLLSPRDLAAYDRIGELLALGVTGFKIEGRLKGPHYVAAATQIYRAAIDAAVAGQPFALTGQQELDLAQSFSRGFTHGFLDGVNHQELVDGRFPKSRGVRIGSVIGRTRRGIVVAVEPSAASAGVAALPLKPGDGVVFDEGRPDRDEQGGRVYSVEPVPVADGRGRERGTRTAREPRGSAADRIELTFGRDDVDLAAVSIGSTVWRTDDPAVRRRLESSFARDQIARRVPITACVRACAGRPLDVTFSDNAGHEAHVASAEPVQEARKHPLTVALLRDQLGRLGETPFELTSIELLGPAGAADEQPVMVPKSVLNDLRRRAAQALMESRAATARHAIAEPNALDAMRRKAAAPLSPVDPRAVTGPSPPLDKGGAGGVEVADARMFGKASPRLYVLVRNSEQLDAVLARSSSSPGVAPTMVYCDFADTRRYADAVAHGRAAGIAIGLATPRILKPGEEDLLRQLVDLAPDAVLVRNLGALDFFGERDPQRALIADYSFNVTNEITAAMLAERGPIRIVPSFDLDWPQLEAMLSRSPVDRFEIVVHCHVPMFHTQHCLFAARLSCRTACDDCGRPCEQHEVCLRDRVGADHPVMADSAGRNTVFNAAVRSALRRLPAMVGRGLHHFRVELLRETAAQTRELLNAVARAWPTSD